MKGLKLELHS